MKLDTRFSESDQSFTPEFGEVHNISDGGYERGYTAGYGKGSTVGYDLGRAEGAEQGYALGYEYAHGLLRGLLNGTQKNFTAEDLHGVTQIPGYLFYSCNTIESVEMPDSITSIGSNAFYTSSLKNCKLSDCLLSIGLHAFSRCYYIDWGDLVLPDTLQLIDNYGFWHNRGLLSVVIPESVTEIRLEAFRHCSALRKVVMRSPVPPTAGTNIFSNTALEVIAVPDGSVEAYKAAANWSTYAAQIKPLSELS